MDLEFKKHEFYHKYSCNRMGQFKMGEDGKIMIGKKRHTGFLYTSDAIPVHELIFTCFNGTIPSGHKVRHLSSCPTDNKLENLKLTKTKSKEEIRSTAHQIKRPIMVLSSSRTLYFKSKNACSKYLGIAVSTVFSCVEQRRKSTTLNTVYGDLEFRYVGDCAIENIQFTTMADQRKGKLRTVLS